jgi:hypothetical protein
MVGNFPFHKKNISFFPFQDRPHVSLRKRICLCKHNGKETGVTKDAAVDAILSVKRFPAVFRQSALRQNLQTSYEAFLSFVENRERIQSVSCHEKHSLPEYALWLLLSEPSCPD